MNLDVRALGRFSRLADEGAARAAAALSVMLDVESEVVVGRVGVATREDVRRELAPESHVGVVVPFRGGVSGNALLVFDRPDAEAVLASLTALADGNDALAESGLAELANVLLSGFVDGWANHLGEEIAPEPSVALDAAAVETVLPEPGVPALAFRNHLTATETGTDFGVYLLPSREAVETVFAATDDEGLPAERLLAFSDLVRDGAAQASAHVSALTGIETVVEVAGLSFAPVEHLPSLVANDVRLGVVLELVGLPSGYIAILFDEASASHVVEALMPGMDADADLRQSAIMEVGNILTSGFVDGWANDLGTTIDISPPTYVHDVAPAILEPVAASLATTQDVGMLVESLVRTPGGIFTCEIYVVPEERGLARALAGRGRREQDPDLHADTGA
jgi:chemotaxis protein CheC